MGSLLALIWAVGVTESFLKKHPERIEAKANSIGRNFLGIKLKYR